MEEQWYADRCRLRELLRAHPDWTKHQLAAQLGRSLSWVKKWRRRLRDAAPDDEQVLWDQARARHRPPAPLEQAVIERLLAIRDQPPAALQRVPGPRTIRYFLAQDAELVASGARLPRSTRTVWQIRTRHGRIAPPPRRVHEPVERPNQALSCGNRPPRVAYPTLPPRPSLPAHVDPDAWLRTVDGRSFARKVRHDGTVALDGDRYYVGQKLAGQPVVLRVRAADHTLLVFHRQQLLKPVRLKGLLAGALPLEAYVTLMRQQAQARQDRSARLTRRGRVA